MERGYHIFRFPVNFPRIESIEKLEDLFPSLRKKKEQKRLSPLRLCFIGRKVRNSQLVFRFFIHILHNVDSNEYCYYYYHIIIYYYVPAEVLYLRSVKNET